jgi:hypothetical protein
VIDVVLVDQVVYVRAAASVLEHAVGLSASTATAYAGKWISLHEGDADYQAIVNSLSPTQAIEEFVPQEPDLRVAGAASVGSRGAVAVSGSPSGQVQGGATATSTLFVSTRAPYLPISSTIVVRNAAGRSEERLASVYGKYNQRVDPIAPQGATPISSLGG